MPAKSAFDHFKEFGAKIFGKNGKKVRPHDTPGKTSHYDHQRVIKELLFVISCCGMDDELKMIMRMRIWGKNPKVFRPMTHEEIAMDLKCKVDDVKKWEEDGMYNVNEFLQKVGTVAATEKFHKDRILKKILQPEKKIRSGYRDK